MLLAAVPRAARKPEEHEHNRDRKRSGSTGGGGTGALVDGPVWLPHPRSIAPMLAPGDKAPSFALPDADSGAVVDDPWREGRTALVFFKTTCPVCQLVVPKVNALADSGARTGGGGARVLGIGEDPPAALQSYAKRHGQHIPTLSESAPYEVSTAFGISTVPTLVLVSPDGIVEDAVAGWDRERWNSLATVAGVAPVSDESDGLPVFRPG